MIICTLKLTFVFCTWVSINPFFLVNTHMHVNFRHIDTVKPIDKWYSKKPENVVFMSSCPLYSG